VLFNKDRLRTLTEWAAPKVSHLVCELDVGSYLTGIRDVQHVGGLAGGDNPQESIDHLLLHISKKRRYLR